ncbi:MAG: sigma-54-dependent Fis family transcriptional regulator [Deltaproteobacteria bacterium]|nr:sigma-54-dependent Fis family transcriptional regulator [Deltaproteobacteria bacterium]
MNQIPYPSLPVLIVDDETEILRSFELTLRAGGIKNIMRCQDSRDVQTLLSNRKIGVILLDLTMPFISGDELLPIITRDFPEILLIIITGNTEVDTAVQCMKFGAFDYMVKPVEESRLVSGVRRAIKIRELQYENLRLKERMLNSRLDNPEAFSEIITNNETMLSIFQYVESIASSPKPVLITGETGVGKELMVRAIHKLSNRQGQFVSVNVAGIDDNIFSDTLFGHVKGAFTGADKMRKGLVEEASGGMLLLDEIGDLDPNSQVKLLRLLQEHEYFPVGSDLPKISDARVIVITNKDLQALQKSGRFRKDLYYRLCAHSIHIPPLRSHSLGKKKPPPHEELITLLSNYHFPGNIRELQSMIYDAVSNHKSKKLSMDQFNAHFAQEGSTERTDSSRFFPKHDSRFVGSKPLPTLEQANRLLIEEAIGISRQRLARHLKSKSK